jgi:carbamoyl-phosphate synthase small subunit
LIIKDLPLKSSNFRSNQDLSEYLVQEHTVAIAQIDTRQLTRHLRSHGAQNGAIVALPSDSSLSQEQIQAAVEVATQQALKAAQIAPSMAGLDLAQQVSCKASYPWSESEWRLFQADGRPGFCEQTHAKFHVVAYDFGIKRNILRMLAQRGCKVTVVPAQTSAAEVLKLRPDGVFFSNGPGDPQPCSYAIAAAKELMQLGLPTFGICLGHQIMALASGASTFKMKFGHHGGNHPVKDLDSGRVCITSQNHGFAVDDKSLPSHVRATHVSLFDGTLQGLARTDCPAFSFQGHPEASPGPHDIAYLFDRFTSLMEHTHA